MQLSKEQVLKIIALARLSAKRENVDQMIRDFNNVLSYVEALNQVDVQDVEPLAHVHESCNVFRNDQIANTMSTEDALANTADRSGSFIRVPLIIETEA